MIEDYLKKLETIISPQTYDLNNYKDKILKSDIDFPDKKFIQGLNDIDNNDDNNNKNFIISPNKEIFQKTLKDAQEDLSNNNKKTNNNTNNNDIISMNNLDIDQKTRNKIHNLNVKNMAYRQQIDSLNRKIEDLNRIVDNQRRQLEENQVTIENNSRYLLKLESYLVEAGKNKARERFTLNLLGISCSFAEECRDKTNKASFSVEKTDLKEMIVTLINENQNLKSFQDKVISLSKQFDDINEHMLLSLKDIKEKLNNFKNDNYQINDNVLNDINSDLNNILFCVEETINSKHDEFKLILDKKEEELSFLRKEIVILNENLENAKRDRLKDQKNMIETECQNNQLHNEIEELQKTIHENYTKLKLLDTENISSKIEKRIEPCKNTTKNILSKLEKAFDLNDKENVRFISSINQNLHTKK